MTSILRHEVAYSLNELLKGLPADSVPKVNGDTPGWQVEMLEEIRQTEPGQRSGAFRLLVNRHPEPGAIYAQVFSADAPPLDPETLPYTDAGNAEMLTILYAERLRFDHRRDRWLIWTGTRWANDKDGELLRLVLASMRHRQVLAQRMKTDNEVQEERRKKAMSWAAGSESRKRIRDAAEIAKNLRPLADSGESWDKSPMLLGVANGVVDLKTGALRNALPDDRITMNTELDYNAEATAPRWEQFLDEVFEGDEELIGFIQRAVGYTLTGSTIEQCLFLCHGGGANGKSTLLDTLREIFGDYAANTPFSTFEMNRQSQNTNDLAMLARVRMVTAAETNEASRLNEARVKAITGGDPITARFLHKEFFTYQPSFKVWLAMNHKPIITGADDGIWRRIRLIPFNASFKKEKADKSLPAKLHAEQQGILSWAVRGALEWQAGGLQEPMIVRAATVDYRRESNNVLRFMDEEIIKDERASVKAGKLYKEYRRWCTDNGEHEVNSNEFGRRLSSAGYEKAKKSGAIRYFGIALPVNEGIFN